MQKDNLGAYDELGLEVPFAGDVPGDGAGEQYAALSSDEYGESPFAAEQVLEHRPRRAVTAAGRLAVAEHPLIRGHRGTNPDLIMRWNQIAGAREVDVVVHFHGYSGQKGSMRLDRDKESISGLDFSDTEGSTAGRQRPTLGVLPRGNFFGGRSGIGYNFPALVRPGALQNLVQDALTRLAEATGEPRTLGRLILTGHSGGGAPLNAVLAHTDPDEVHLFDGTYGDASNIVAWAKKRIARGGAPSALRVLYIPGSSTQRQAQVIARALKPALDGAAAQRAFFRIEATSVPHNLIPRRFGWRLLADPGGDLPDVRPPSGARESEELSMAAESLDASEAWQEPATLREESERAAEGLEETFEALAWLDTEGFDPAESEDEEAEPAASAAEGGAGEQEAFDLFEPSESEEDEALEALEHEDESPEIGSLDAAAETKDRAEGFDESWEHAEDEDETPDRFDEQEDELDLEWSLDEREDEGGDESALAGSGLTSAEQKAVEITSTFETGKPGGFYGLSGNFDGQGLSFGLVNWTVGTGSLQPLLRDFAREHPQRWATAFGPHAAGFLRVITPTGRAAEKEQRRFAVEEMNSVTVIRGRKRWAIKEPWATYFSRLSEDREFQQIQVRYVRVLLKRADEYCRALGLRSERAFAFMFDAVSSHGRGWLTKRIGGMQKRKLAIDAGLQRLRAQHGGRPVPESAILLLIADVLAATSAARWAAKVRARKRWFVTGEHPRARELWARMPGDAPYTVSGGAAASLPEEEVPILSAIAAGDLGAAIARISEEEYRRWHAPSGDIRETDAAAVPILQRYYREGVNQTVSAANLRSDAWQAHHPWSAVFVSWVMRTAGAGATFKYATAHQSYIRAARRNRLDGNTSSPFWAYRATEVAPAVGDLICASRKNSGATYDNIAGAQVRATHCDIVTEVMPGKIRVIGGNVRQNVDAKIVRLKPDGTLALDGTQSRFFAVIRCRGAIGSFTPVPQPPRPAQTPSAPAPSGGARLPVAQFVARYAPAAQRSQQANGVPALVTLGQAALESGWGAHAPRFNFFGIKARPTDPEGARQLLRTREVCATRTCKFPEIISITPRSDGRFNYVVRDWFRAYPDADTAFNAHGQFLVKNRRYAKAFAVAHDPHAFATEVARAGYATDPSYAKTLTSVMKKIEAVMQN